MEIAYAAFPFVFGGKKERVIQLMKPYNAGAATPEPSHLRNKDLHSGFYPAYILLSVLQSSPVRSERVNAALCSGGDSTMKWLAGKAELEQNARGSLGEELVSGGIYLRLGLIEG